MRACNRQWHHYRYITLLIYPRYYPLRPTCFPRYFLHLCYDWSLCLAPSLPLVVWLRCRFIQAATALFIVSVFRRLYAYAVVDVVCFFLFCYFIIRDHIASAFFVPSVITLRPFALYLTSLRVLDSWRQWMDSNHRSSHCYIPVAPADIGRTLQSALSAYRLSLP